VIGFGNQGAIAAGGGDEGIRQRTEEMCERKRGRGEEGKSAVEGVGGWRVTDAKFSFPVNTGVPSAESLSRCAELGLWADGSVACGNGLCGGVGPLGTNRGVIERLSLGDASLGDDDGLTLDAAVCASFLPTIDSLVAESRRSKPPIPGMPPPVISFAPLPLDAPAAVAA
jgi:hypothetical protein